MKINHINSKKELERHIYKYQNQYDKLFFITQQTILKKAPIVNIIAQNGYKYICGENENCKSLDEYSKVIEFLSKNHCNKNSAIVSIGGGTVTDLCGFVASSYMRGISHIVIPTTLLGMVDAAIGGKTALNVQKIRNLIGSYKNPDAIIIYTMFINSLNKNDMINGYAEIIKYALIMDETLFIKIEENIEELLSNTNLNLIESIIETCMNHKLNIVNQDPYDEGIRNILNFGHTVGHALEGFLNFKISHGVAVLYGMHVASYLSYEKKNITAKEYNRITSLIKKIGLKKIEKLDSNKILKLITLDKKNMGGKLNYILLKKIGSAYIEKNYNKKSLILGLKIL